MDRSEQLRQDLLTFEQGPTETLKAAWARFKMYQRDCPHHGFSEVQLLSAFFRGLDFWYQRAMDTGSDGNFYTKTPEEAKELIKNLMTSSSVKNADKERQRSSCGDDSLQIADLRDKVDYVHNMVVAGEFVEVNYVNEADFHEHTSRSQQRQAPRSNGYSPHQVPPTKEQTKIESMLEQLLLGQNKMTQDLNGKMDFMYQDMSGKLESLTSRVDNLDARMTQVETSIQTEHVKAASAEEEVEQIRETKVLELENPRKIQNVRLASIDLKKLQTASEDSLMASCIKLEGYLTHGKHLDIIGNDIFCELKFLREALPSVAMRPIEVIGFLKKVEDFYPNSSIDPESPPNLPNFLNPSPENQENNEKKAKETEVKVLNTVEGKRKWKQKEKPEKE
ncbi:hypothetical protein U6M95_12495, partial [Cutibacterium acnes]